MVRNILSVILGAIAGWTLFTLIQLINYLIVPVPPDFDIFSTSSKKQLIDTLPYYAWLVLVLSYLIGSFVGGFVAGKIAESKTRVFPLLVAAIFMLGWLSNVAVIPHPLLIVIFVVLSFLPATIAGHRMAIGFRE